MAEKNMARVTKEFNTKDRIRNLQKEFGWNDYVLSERSGISRSTISRWWSGEVEISGRSVARICEAFEISVDEFYSGTAREHEGMKSGIELSELQNDWDLLGCTDRDLIQRLIKRFVSYISER